MPRKTFTISPQNNNELKTRSTRKSDPSKILNTALEEYFKENPQTE